jgi:leader peptidase (prepilin peptidase)/N-methyltransferase
MDLDSNAHLIRIFGTIFAGLLGLAFGSFLNVCLSRWPAGESIVKPGSHCRNCDHMLAWWENIPLVSWLALRGRCRKCQTAISWRYTLVELSIGVLWANAAWSSISEIPLLPSTAISMAEEGLAQLIFVWILIALAFLDAESLWLPNFLTLPGTFLGLLLTFFFQSHGNSFFRPAQPFRLFLLRVVGIFAAAALILLIRWLYKLIRHREGIGLGDAKLMALLAAWLGLPGTLLSFFFAAILGSLAALALLAVPTARRDSDSWANSKLPLGTFLCIGGIVSSLWGQQILAAYFRWAGF